MAKIRGGAAVGLSGVWVGGMYPEGRGKRGGDGSGLSVASGEGDDVKQAVGFETISGADIDSAIGHGLRHKMADGRQRIAPIKCLTRRIEQFEINGIKRRELTIDKPQNSVAVAIGGDGRRRNPRILSTGFDRTAAQASGQVGSHERR